MVSSANQSRYFSYLVFNCQLIVTYKLSIVSHKNSNGAWNAAENEWEKSVVIKRFLEKAIEALNLHCTALVISEQSRLDHSLVQSRPWSTLQATFTSVGQ